MNGFILVFGMVLVLAVERRFAADRALPAAQLAADSPAPWRGARPQSATPRPWAAAVPWPGVRPQPTAVPWPSAQPAADGPTP